jgi:hypothetical protein
MCLKSNSKGKSSNKKRMLKYKRSESSRFRSNKRIMKLREEEKVLMCTLKSSITHLSTELTRSKKILPILTLLVSGKLFKIQKRLGPKFSN